jgi:hypothetical protein
MEKPIQAFFDKLPKEKAAIAFQLRDFILKSYPQVSESIKWNQLVFHFNKVNIAFIYTYSKVGYINFGFFNATSLHDPLGKFEGTGKRMRHIKLYKKADIPKSQVNKWFGEQIALIEMSRI